MDIGNILKYEYGSRPFKTIEEMDEEYIKRWNSKIKKKDEVYILGDFSFYKGEKTNEILRRLNGIKYLIKGNHDRTYLNDLFGFDYGLFQWIEDYYVVKDDNDVIVLFHYPIQVWDRQQYGALHFYGHIHSNSGSYKPMKYEIPNSYNVGIDILKEPMTKDEILKFYRKENDDS